MFLYLDAIHYHGQPNVFIDDKGRALFEIDDSKSRFKLSEGELRQEKSSAYKISDLLDHPELFSNYPHIRDKPVFLYHTPEAEQRADSWFVKEEQAEHVRPDPTGARSPDWQPHDGYYKIHGRNKYALTKIHSNLLHEIQHDIQGHAGAMPSGRHTPTLGWARDIVQTFREDVQELPPEQRAAFARSIKQIARTPVVGTQHIPSSFNAQAGVHDPHLPADIVRQYHLQRALKKVLKVAPYGDRDPDVRAVVSHLQYFHFPHEIMAREVQARQHLTMAERLNMRPQFAATWPTENPVGPVMGSVAFFGTWERSSARKNFAEEQKRIVAFEMAKRADSKPDLLPAPHKPAFRP